MQSLPKFQEEYSAKLPALALLHNLGWKFLTPAEALAARNDKEDAVVLQHVLRKELEKRSFIFEGKEHYLSEQTINQLIYTLSSPALNEGLVKANERLYNHMLYGIAVTEFINGRKATPTIPIIDWQNPSNNSFIFTEEFNVTRSGMVGKRIPDIVCFVNGLPWVVIEAKRPDGKKGPTIEEGISQNLRNQRSDQIPHLFAYSQLLLSINGYEGRYGTCETPQKFWAAWREEKLQLPELMALKNKRLDDATIERIFANRQPQDKAWFKQWQSAGELALTEQDTLLIGVLTPERLLEMMRYFTIFDNKIGKIVARYQQVFSVHEMLKRLSTTNSQGAREGGVIWHTTGSGKSLTMVFLSKSLLLSEELKQCRLIVVTDRVDLENQLSKTFASSGELASRDELAKAKAKSGKDLAKQIGKSNDRIIFSLIQKFTSATQQPECYNDSPNIIVLIDEGHRSQSGENHIRMQQALPNAAFIAFTGTPLLKDDKTTKKFGPILHAYTMQRAVEDATVTPLLYEERIPELDVHERAIDSWFDRITATLTDEQKTDLKKKYAKKGEIYKAEDRIRLIALDIAEHFEQNIDEGLKAQLACDSKASAILYKQYLDEIGAFESAVVISPPDTREGNTSVDDDDMPAVTKWWKENVGSQDDAEYTKQVIDRFEKDDDLKLIIVVDKLLTGFDAPNNAVLYIDKPLKQHNLIQAIARVNRLHPKKRFGLLIDYRGILAELDTTIKDYQDLASRTQGGYDIEDIDGLYTAMDTEYKKLPFLYKELWAVFDHVKNKSDIEQLRQVLIPKQELRGEALIDVNQERRDTFYQRLTDFASCLKIALQSKTFFDDTSFSDEDRRNYKETVKQLSSLRQAVQQSSGESVDYSQYAEEVKKLLDKHVAGVSVKESEGVFEVGGLGTTGNPEEWSDDKTRNETDIIKTRIAKTIEEDLRDDPYAQEAFSKLLRQAIEEAEKQFDHPLKQYMLFKEFEEQVQERKLDDIPDAFDGNRQAQAYFGVFKQVLPDADINTDEWISLAFDIDRHVQEAINEHSINPQNIEADIKRRLLAKLWSACRDGGDARAVVESIIQIVRVGLGS